MPLFHIVSLDTAQKASAGHRFNAGDYVDALWETLVNKDLHHVVAASTLVAALDKDPEDAAARFGKALGLGSSAAYFVAGRGKVIAAGDDSVHVELAGNTRPYFVIELGPVFGNAVRDGSGLLDVSDFANSQEFNAISSEINRRVEDQVLSLLKENAQVGREIGFIGGIDSISEQSLTLVPVHLEFQ